MFKRRIILLGVIFGSACVNTGCSPRQDKGPSANGRTLSDWVILCATTDPKLPAHEEAAAAIQKVGTNAVPHLLRWLREEPPEGQYSTEQHIRAMAVPPAFTALGDKGTSAVPELATMLVGGEPTVSARAAHCLGRIGPLGLPVLVGALDSARPDVRKNAADFMIFMGTNARPAIQALQRKTNDPDPNVREAVSVILDVLDPKRATKL